MTGIITRAIILPALIIFEKEFFMSFEFILRIIGMFVLAIAGGYWGFDIAKLNPQTTDPYVTTTIFGL
ncbi:hypothetical protein JZU69_03385, partial [bacterium]|nr:hypothetical protein [bacterium]